VLLSSQLQDCIAEHSSSSEHFFERLELFSVDFANVVFVESCCLLGSCKAHLFENLHKFNSTSYKASVYLCYLCYISGGLDCLSSSNHDREADPVEQAPAHWHETSSLKSELLMKLLLLCV
jgi:hypothetical protein